MKTPTKVAIALAIASTSIIALTQGAAAKDGDNARMATRAFACADKYDVAVLDDMLHGNGAKTGAIPGEHSTSGCRILAKGELVRITKDSRGFACVLTKGAHSCLWVDSVWVTE